MPRCFCSAPTAALTVVGHVQALGLHLGRHAEQAQLLQNLWLTLGGGRGRKSEWFES